MTHISLEWLGGGRWRLSVTRGQVEGPALDRAQRPGTLRRVSTVEGTFENLRRVALRAFRTLELESDADASPPPEQISELEPTLAYPISLDAVTPPIGAPFDVPTPVVKNPFLEITAHGAPTESRLELADVTVVVLPPPFSVNAEGLAASRD